MRINIFAVHDQKAAGFLHPMFFQTRGQAIRAFTDAVNDEKHQFHHHPEDYTLYHVGTWDDESATFENVTPPAVLSLAKNAILNGGSQ